MVRMTFRRVDGGLWCWCYQRPECPWRHCRLHCSRSAAASSGPIPRRCFRRWSNCNLKIQYKIQHDPVSPVRASSIGRKLFIDQSNQSTARFMLTNPVKPILQAVNRKHSAKVNDAGSRYSKQAVDRPEDPRQSISQSITGPISQSTEDRTVHQSINHFRLLVIHRKITE